MTRYVLAFAHEIPKSLQQNIILVTKTKPTWQRGLLNLPGGHIEAGETPEQAACRELYEETSIQANAWDANVLGIMNGPEWEVTIVRCMFQPWYGGSYQAAKTMTEEEVVTLDFRTALEDPRLIENLKVIIPLCMTQVSGWRLSAAGPNIGKETWVVTI